jgi:hypothetical protein
LKRGAGREDVSKQMVKKKKHRECEEVQPSGHGVEERRKDRRQGSGEVERTEEGEP